MTPYVTIVSHTSNHKFYIQHAKESISDPLGTNRLNEKKLNCKQSFTFTKSCSTDEVVINHEMYLELYICFRCQESFIHFIIHTWRNTWFTRETSYSKCDICTYSLSNLTNTVYQKGRSHINVANVSSDALKRSTWRFFIEETHCKSSWGKELALLSWKSQGVANWTKSDICNHEF